MNRLKRQCKCLILILFWCFVEQICAIAPSYATSITFTCGTGSYTVVAGKLTDGKSCSGDLNIDDSVTSIGVEAFSRNTLLTSVVIPDSVVTIGTLAFSYNTSLSSLVIGNSVTTIGDNAFWENTALKSVIIPNSVTSIGEGAFAVDIDSHSGNTALTSVTIGNSVITIGDMAFFGNWNLANVNIGISVVNIGNDAFGEARKLTSLNIPDSVLTIGIAAFSNNILTSVDFGSSVQTIARYAFSRSKNLTSLTIPNSVTTIGNSAFSENTSLRSVVVGDHVNEIGEDVFWDSAQLESVTFLGNAPTIGGAHTFPILTPTRATASVLRSATGFGPDGAIWANLIVSVGDAPSFSYTPTSLNAIEGEAISAWTPNSDGGPIASWSINPTLPTGLLLDTSTGVISGTPTVISAIGTYTVTALSPQKWSKSKTITIGTSAPAIEASPIISYAPTSISAVVGAAVAALVPNNTGGTITNWSITPTLPAGLSINNATGEISGTPTVTSASTSYTVTANGPGGSPTKIITISIAAAPTPPPVIPVPTPKPVVVIGPPPSTLKTITKPTISRELNSFKCTAGTFIFIRNGSSEEAPKLTSQIFSLMQNGVIVASNSTLETTIIFPLSSASINSTVSCQVQAGQENLISTVSSLNSELMNTLSQEKTHQFKEIDLKYYSDRQTAYAMKALEFARILSIKKVEISQAKNAEAIITASNKYRKSFTAASLKWKEELLKASRDRLESKEAAQLKYLNALENAGVSVYTQ